MCAGQKLLGVNVWTGIDLVLVCGLKVTWFVGMDSLGFVWVVEIDLVLYVGQKSLDFTVSIEDGFVFCVGG